MADEERHSDPTSQSGEFDPARDLPPDALRQWNEFMQGLPPGMDKAIAERLKDLRRRKPKLSAEFAPSAATAGSDSPLARGAGKEPALSAETRAPESAPGRPGGLIEKRPEPGSLPDRPAEVSEVRSPTGPDLTAGGGASHIQSADLGDDSALQPSDATTYEAPPPANQMEFLAKHTELKPSPVHEQEYVEIRRGIAEDQKQVCQDLAELNEHASKVLRELAQATRTKELNVHDMAAKINDVLDPTKKQEFLAGAQFLQRRSGEIAVRALALGQQGRKLAEAQKQFVFADGLSRIDGLPEQQRKTVYRHLEQILEGGEWSKAVGLTDDERRQIACELVNQIGLPQQIKQGGRLTGVAAGIEFLLASKHPDRYATHVATLTTYGKLNDKDALALADFIRDDGKPSRCLTSMIVQTAITCLAAQEESPPLHYLNLKPGVAAAAGRLPEFQGTALSGGTGEWLSNGGNILSGLKISLKRQLQLLNELAGRSAFSHEPLPAPYEAKPLAPADPQDLYNKLKLAGGPDGQAYPLALSIASSQGGERLLFVVGVEEAPPAGKVKYLDVAEPDVKPQAIGAAEFFKILLKAQNTGPDGRPTDIPRTDLFGKPIPPSLQMIVFNKPA